MRYQWQNQERMQAEQTVGQCIAWNLSIHSQASGGVIVRDSLLHLDILSSPSCNMRFQVLSRGLRRSRYSSTIGEAQVQRVCDARSLTSVKVEFVDVVTYMMVLQREPLQSRFDHNFSEADSGR